jgi:hypothetical protein
MGKQLDILSSEKAERLLVLMERVWHPLESARLMEGNITEIRVRGPKNGSPEIMVIVKAEVDGTLFVGFHSADTYGDALKGALERIQNGQLKWREDKPFQPK